MGKMKDIAKTSVGVFAGTVAKDSFGAATREQDPTIRLKLNVLGSVAAATSFHLLKDDAKEVRSIVFGQDQKKLDHLV